MPTPGFRGLDLVPTEPGLLEIDDACCIDDIVVSQGGRSGAGTFIVLGRLHGSGRDRPVRTAMAACPTSSPGVPVRWQTMVNGARMAPEGGPYSSIPVQVETPPAANPRVLP